MGEEQYLLRKALPAARRIEELIWSSDRSLPSGARSDCSAICLKMPIIQTRRSSKPSSKADPYLENLLRHATIIDEGDDKASRPSGSKSAAR